MMYRGRLPTAVDTVEIEDPADAVRLDGLDQVAVHRGAGFRESVDVVGTTNGHRHTARRLATRPELGGRLGAENAEDHDLAVLAGVRLRRTMIDRIVWRRSRADCVNTSVELLRNLREFASENRN